MTDPTQRFSDRVADYVRYRPGYPPGVLEALRDRAGLDASTVVADVGSGTGISAELFLRNGNAVFGVEPNAEMRAAAERLLAGTGRFTSVNGTAEATTLPGASVGLVVAGQAFHWFRPAEARAEFARILRPGGYVALVWNVRRLGATPFLRDYEALLQRFGTDYREVSHRTVDVARLETFFSDEAFARDVFDNEQRFDLAGLTGRLLSSSYAPTARHPDHEPMLAELARLFEAHEAGGTVCLEYDTKVYIGVSPLSSRAYALTAR